MAEGEWLANSRRNDDGQNIEHCCVGRVPGFVRDEARRQHADEPAACDVCADDDGDRHAAGHCLYHADQGFSHSSPHQHSRSAAYVVANADRFTHSRSPHGDLFASAGHSNAPAYTRARHCFA